MKIHNKIVFIISLLLLLPALVFSQGYFLNRANRYYDQQAYSKAIEPYINYLASGDDFRVMAKLANCYRLTNDGVKAERLYEVVVRSNEALPIHYLNYAKTLMGNKKYSEAKDWFIEYYKAVPSDKYAQDYIRACENVDLLLKSDSTKYKVFNLNINSEQSDFGATSYKDGIVYASAREGQTKFFMRFGWTDEPYLDLYFSSGGHQDKFREPVPFSDKINTKFHEGPLSFATGQTFVYFTRNNFNKGKTNLSSAGINKLSIYTACEKNDEWDEIKLFDFNNPEYSIGHPSISTDGKVLYFISDMPGGFGGTDIYVCRKLGFNWTKPVNLGANVNTSGNEMFPFIHPDGSLYFSSDGHVGLGGLDIFVTRYNGFKWEHPINLKHPFNSSKDDFAYTVNKTHTIGYFSSNREGGKGGDDIYYFEKNLDLLKGLKGRVISAASKMPIGEVNVILQDYINTDMQKLTNPEGAFDFKLDPGQNYNIVVSKPGFKTKSVSYSEIDYKNIMEPYLEIELESSIWIKLEGFISDAETNTPIDLVSVELKNQTYDISTTMNSTAEGKFEFDLDPQSIYVVVFKKDGYFSESINDLSTFGKSESEIIHYDVLLGMKRMVVDKAIELKDIYYDLNKWDLKPKALKECDKLVGLLQSNPHITIELSSHTDSRASDEYNLELSQKRADAVAEYVISKGIEKSRIIPKGYGETRLKNNCANGVPCPESLHQQNRRTEFKVIGN
ncbi:MAG: carboxypeptidase regulatory-like domain-containing protein [Bacteroidales bacterium]|nr:carboxypeptidase regulatory-like domain-containing protein [Bacteroidales bacterium]MCF8456320.1 carboxypeptidase regulatory-like domain-containing protein [Bacteroidales bacterium]